MADYTVLGAGAIGGSLAHHLSVAGHRVTVVDADARHVHALRSRGITVLRPDGRRDSVSVANAFTPQEAERAAAIHQRVLLATKAQHVGDAARWLAPHLAEDGVVVLCQNSDTFGEAAASLGSERPVSAFVNFAADVVEPGVIRFGGEGQLVIGEYGAPAGDRVASLVRDLDGFGRVSASDNVLGYLWAKRGVGAILAATALVDEPVADVIDSARPLMSALATEVYRVALASGVRFETIDGIRPAHLMDEADPDERTAAFDRLVAFTGGMAAKPRSGVFRDIAVRHRPTEARPELLLLAALAREVRIPVPLIARLASIIGELEQGSRRFGRSNLADLAGTPSPDRAAANSSMTDRNTP
ncbi:2-dehydropantoate 2-reductase N-terminal domain-containing protein [Streptomyces sp. NPDC026665]|uniref:ketopantoate reductase family protein n=1 Tax=Streptomyces sp. NPDC026665 TaxID=3154798 RepID=UPI0033FC3AA9